jgi:hypothetical protein
MTTRKIEKIVKPGAKHWVGDGFNVHNIIPGTPGLNMERMNPFILLDYNSKTHFAPSEKARGVGVHPHRGFETVTIAFKGKVAHHDSAGNSGIIGEGEVQWMTAAAGILHKEYHEKEFSRKGGDFQMVQLWVNLPAKDKMSAPKYQGIERKNMPIVELENGSIEVIAGQYKLTKGAATSFSPIHLYSTKLQAGAAQSFAFPNYYNTALLVIEGEVEINKASKVGQDHFVVFENNAGEEIHIMAAQQSVVLLMSGEPLNEPIAAGGPFVMNTREELMQAYEDFNQGKFGYLAD